MNENIQELNFISEEMIKAGNDIASNLMTACCCKSMNGVGGGKDWTTWLDENKDAQNVDIMMAYANNEIDSVTAIYIAMERTKVKN